MEPTLRADRSEPGPTDCSARWAAALVALAALVPRLLTIGRHYNLDEHLWMRRSGAFSDALMGAHLSDMTALEPYAGTMPGITVVWLGSLARAIWSLGGVLGIVDPGQEFAYASSAYVTAQAMVAVTTVVLIGMIVWLVARWISLRVAVATGVVLATEPIWVGLGSIFHTDELVALFGLAGLVALAWSLGIPSPHVVAPRPRRWAIAATVLLVCSALTKLSGAAFGVPAAGMILWALLRAVRNRTARTGPLAACRSLLGTLGWMAAAGAATVLVSYPALVLDTAAQWRGLRAQLDTLGGDRRVFFLGRYSARPGIEFYPITLAYHATVGFLVLAPIGVVVGLVRRTTRTHVLLILAWAVVPGVSMLTSGLVYERYALAVLGPLTLAAAMALQPRTTAAVHWWRDRVGVGITVVGAVALGMAVLAAPWGWITYNPVLSALRSPETVLTIGWGEPVGLALPVIERDAAARGLDCAEITVAGMDRPPSPTGCHPENASRRDADYLIVPEYRRQRSSQARRAPEGFALVESVSVRGHPVVQVWRRADSSDTPGRG